MRKGETFNESVTFEDEATGRPTRRLTRSGLYNQTPTYHFNTAFSADSRYLVFASAREGGSAILRAELETGDLTVLAVADGIGSGGDIYVAAAAGGGYTGALALVQASGWVAAVLGRSLRLVHLETLQERVLIEDVGRAHRFGQPAGSLDGRRVAVPRTPAHPDEAAGLERPRREYFEALVETFGGRPTTFLEIAIETGAIEEVFHEERFGCNHVQPSPAGADLWLIDRDAPPHFSHGSDGGRTTRAWLLEPRTRALTELRPRDANRFQIHTNWNRRGDRVYYHGRSARGGHPVHVAGGGHYVGVADTAGRVLWEHHWPYFHYGHLSTHTRAEAIITDGLVTPDLVTAIHYEDLDAKGHPRIEVLARHGTDWKGMPGQFPHPHCHMSPDGRWLSYNRAEPARSDVCVVEVG